MIGFGIYFNLSLTSAGHLVKILINCTLQILMMLVFFMMIKLIKIYNNVIYRKYKKEMILYFFGMQMYLILHTLLLAYSMTFIKEKDGFTRDV